MGQYISKDALVAEIEKLKGQLLRGACSSQISMETYCKEEAYNEIISFLDTQSEDEKIRKALKQYFVNSFRNNGVAAICGVHVKDVLAWLEKQGQVKESHISQYEIETCKENGNSLTYEDEKIRKEIINYFQCQSEEEPTRKEIHNKWIAWLEKQELKSNPYSGVSFNYNGNTWSMCARDNGVDISCDKHLIKHLEKQGEQKPTDEEMKTLFRTECEKGRADAIAKMQKEWGEEDEKMINKLLAVVKLYYDRDGDDLDKQSCISWLKSLRPHQQWKPSDGQIRFLQAMVNDPNNASSESCQIVLKDILEKLKKLKEEKV